MFEGALGRLLSGALWGVGAGLVLTVVQNREVGLKPIAKEAMKVYLAASDKVQELTAEARDSLEDLYAEAKAEQAEGGSETSEAPAASSETPAP
jgi:hypothetical protein